MPKDAHIGDVVLLVDDSRDEIGFLINALESADLMAVSANDGRAALSLLEDMTPQLIVMDAMMPGMDGFETCRQLKREKRFAHVPVIFMTGLTDTAHVLKGFDAGGVDYVTKPVRLEELLARIRIHISNSRVAAGACEALDAAGRYLMATDRLGEARWCTPQAAQFLSTAFVEGNDGGGVPLEMKSRLRQLIGSGELKGTVTIESPGHSPMVVAFLGQSGGDEFLFSLSAEVAEPQQERVRRRYSLTSREAEVLTWITRGKSNREISDILVISPRTVNKHLEHIFAKMGVENRASAACLVLQTAD